MGIAFDPQDTNLMAYLITAAQQAYGLRRGQDEESWRPFRGGPWGGPWREGRWERWPSRTAPSTESDGANFPLVTPAELEAFLTRAQTSDAETFLSHSDEWIQQMRAALEHVHQNLSMERRRARDAGQEDDRPIPPTKLMAILEPLAAEVLRFPVFGAVLGMHIGTAVEIVRAMPSIVFFATTAQLEPSQLRLLNPLPAFAAVAEALDHWPGVLFWQRGNPREAAFVREQDCFEVARDIDEAAHYGKEDTVLQSYRDWTRRQRSSITILQLSDLHFGTKEADGNVRYLKAHLRGRVKTMSRMSRVVITGDLWNTPNRRQADAFDDFRADLREMSGNQIIVVPGNHDMRLLGNSLSWWRLTAGRDLREIVRLEWSHLVVDHENACVFLCFDSSEEGNWARGHITTAQLRDVGTALDSEINADPRVAEYLRIALLHHHPVPFDVVAESPLQRLLKSVGFREEHFLAMENGDAFLNWCGHRSVTLALHGHKHVPRRVDWVVNTPVGARGVTAIGCGSSLGVEQQPLSYNLLTWNPSVRRWSSRVVSSASDASAWYETDLSVSEAVEQPADRAAS